MDQQRKGQKLLNGIYNKVPPHEAPKQLVDVFWREKCLALERYIWNMSDEEFDAIMLATFDQGRPTKGGATP